MVTTILKTQTVLDMIRRKQNVSYVQQGIIIPAKTVYVLQFPHSVKLGTIIQVNVLLAIKAIPSPMVSAVFNSKMILVYFL